MVYGRGHRQWWEGGRSTADLPHRHPAGDPRFFFICPIDRNADLSTTAETLSRMMARNVSEVYGSGRFPNMDICAKSGTGVGGETPTSWFSGFLRNEDAPMPLQWLWRRAEAVPKPLEASPPAC